MKFKLVNVMFQLIHSNGMAGVLLKPRNVNNLQRPNLFLSHNVYYGQLALTVVDPSFRTNVSEALDVSSTMPAQSSASEPLFASSA